MLRNLTLAVAVTLALTVARAAADEQKPQEGKNEQGIKSEVRGILHFEGGRGYFITVKPAEKEGHETRVWLRAAEDKALVRKMQGLDGKEVTARGNMAQMPQDVGSSVPPLGIYLKHGFQIERAGAK